MKTSSSNGISIMNSTKILSKMLSALEVIKIAFKNNKFKETNRI
jgi:hypothetical protein